MPELTTKEALLERMVAATEDLVTDIPSKLNDCLPLTGGTITGDLEVNGALTKAGKNVETVNASGTNYIRYESGLQIIFKSVTGSTTAKTETFEMPFTSVPIVTASPSTRTLYSISGVTSTEFTHRVDDGTPTLRYIAIGWWK